MNDNISELKETEKTNEANDNNMIFAIVLILVGVAVMVGNLTDFSFENWWALFMLIPAGFMFMNVWRDYQENGRFTHKSSGAIIPGVIILTMIAIFLFNLSWAIFWPASLIAVGLSIIVGSRS
jgi:uncharacterized membrane protein YhaH (DUF805 family)